MTPRDLRPGFPERPAHLDGEAAGLWDAVAADCWQRGTLTESTVPLLGAYVTLSAELIAVTRRLDAEGHVVTAKNGRLVAHPLWKVQLRLIGELRRLGNQLGLSLLGRARMRERRGKTSV